jgi:hypothetical protein
VVEGVEPLQVAGVDRRHELADPGPPCLVVHRRSPFGPRASKP